MKKSSLVLKSRIMSAAIALVLGGAIVSTPAMPSVDAKAHTTKAVSTFGNDWTDTAPAGKYESRTVFRSKKVSYTTSNTSANLSGWTLYHTDSQTVGRGDKVEYGEGRENIAPAKAGAYRVWAEQINYQYNPDIYVRPTLDLSITSVKSENTTSMIKWIQVSLLRFGYSDNVDGVYGKLTFANVKKFQQDNGIAATGIFGYITRVKMIEKLEEQPLYKYYYESADTVNTYNFYKVDANWSCWQTTEICGDTTLNAGSTQVLVEKKTQYRAIEEDPVEEDTEETCDEDDTELQAPTVKKISFKAKLTRVKVNSEDGADGYECIAIQLNSTKLTKIQKQLNGGNDVSVKGMKIFISKKSTVDCKNLKKGKKYVILARAYKIVDGKKVYSSFSGLKVVKIKK